MLFSSLLELFKRKPKGVHYCGTALERVVITDQECRRCPKCRTIDVLGWVKT